MYSVDLLQVDLTRFSASEASFLGREAAKRHINSKEGLFFESVGILQLLQT